jgi:hypothetical protein
MCPPLTPDQEKGIHLLEKAMEKVDFSPSSSEKQEEEVVAGENRLAAVNKFKLNPEEPQRGLQELVHALMEELGTGQERREKERERKEERVGARNKEGRDREWARSRND